MLRSILAVVAGYAIFAISAGLLFPLTGHDPHAPANAAFMTATILYGICFAAVGGRVAAQLAPSRPMLHAVIVAVILAIGATASLVMVKSPGLNWSALAALCLMAPAVLLGGWLRTRGMATSPRT